MSAALAWPPHDRELDLLARGRTKQIDPQGFDLFRIGPLEEREGPGEGPLPGGAAPRLR